MTNWPAIGWLVHPLAQDLRVQVARSMPELPGALDAEVERLWALAQRRLGGVLFNGRVFSTDAIEPHRITGHWTEFRRVVAQMERPELFDALALRPTATGGTLVCADGVLFGRRPADAIYQAGLWQLPPAGSLDPGAAGPDGRVDIMAQIFAELSEELGMDRAAIAQTSVLCAAEHAGSHVLDIGITLHTYVCEADIRAAHAARGNTEYRALRVVPLADLPEFVAETGELMTPQALAFLAEAGLLPCSAQDTGQTGG